ncbi:MAG: glycogen/starch/alpha-glucan phosphorylase, partial [Methylococcales bacterium]|nr:glycogen/starch/alpha-glucan phosphorylase [Methylococcales bacterium]
MPDKKFKLSKPSPNIAKLPDLGLSKKELGADFQRYYSQHLGQDEYSQSPYYAYEALSMAIADRLVENRKKTYRAYHNQNCKKTFYLSLEFLMGRTLSNAMLNLGITDSVTKAMYDLGLQIEELVDSESDAGLGNGGLGRLAACFIDSCATLQLPVTGHGLRYEYGMFSQTIVNGEQVEGPDHWLRNGNVWEIERPEFARRIKFG